MYLQSHAANQAIKGFEIQALRPMDIKTVVQITGTFLPSLLSSCYIHFDPPQRTRNPQTLPNHILLPVPPEDETNKPLCQPLLVKVNLHSRRWVVYVRGHKEWTVS